MIRTGEQRRLARVVGVPGAVLMGLGSIPGTGIFVSIGIAAGVAGPSVILAVAATAALGFGGYVLILFGQSGMAARIVLALVAIGLLTVVLASGMRQSNRSNAVIVAATPGCSTRPP